MSGFWMVEMCLVVEWSGFQMPFKNLTKFKMSGFKIFPVFECFRISNDQFSDPHCIHICVTSLMNVHLPHNAEHSSFFVGAHSIFWLFEISFWSWPWTVTAALTLGFRTEIKIVLSTSSLIRPSNSIRATIYGIDEKRFFYVIFALIASLLCREGKQAIISRQTNKQSIKFKAGEIKCCKERNSTAPPNKWHNIPF